MNDYRSLRARYGVAESEAPWELLGGAYDADLVERMRDHYAGSARGVG
jgi:hypothetical protein